MQQKKKKNCLQLFHLILSKKPMYIFTEQALKTTKEIKEK